MTKVFYMVGTNGYETRCNTMAEAKRQCGEDNECGYHIRTCYEEVKNPVPKLSEKRLAWLKESKGRRKPL